MQNFLQRIMTASNSALASLSKTIRKNRDFYDFVISQTSFLPENADVPFRLFHIRSGLIEQIKCKKCGTPLSKIRIEFCNRKCAADFNNGLTEVQAKRAASLIKTFSKKTDCEKLEIRKKREATNLERGDHISNLHSVEGKKKVRETFILNYGYDNPNKNSSIKEKISKANKAKSKQALEVRKKTCLEKYGVDNVMRTQSTKDKIKETCLTKYGAPSHMQNDDFLEKYFNEYYRQFQFKPYILPSGKTVNLLGYELTFLDYLLTKFNESEITIGYSAYQKIKCTYEQSGKIHRYIPDFYIESKNLVIEVKSNYTYTFADPKKRKSVKEKGINFIYAIVDIQNNNILFKRYE